MRCAVLAIVAVGCHFTHGAGPAAGDAGHLDAPIDGAIGPDATDASDASTSPLCFGGEPIDHACLASLPTGSMTFGTVTIDTDTSNLCEMMTANGVPVCVVAYQSITIPDMQKV